MIVIYLSKRHNTHIPYIIRLNVIKSARDFLELLCAQKILRKRVDACEHWAMKYMDQMHVAEQDQMALW
ncbi:hypothetical protein D9M71_750490 [compost metagenome]